MKYRQYALIPTIRCIHLPVLKTLESWILKSRKFFSEGVQLWLFFLSWWGREDPNTTKSGPSSARSETPLNGVSLAGRWWSNIECWLGRFDVLQGIRTSIAKKPYIFVIFQGVRTPNHPLPPPYLYPRMIVIFNPRLNIEKRLINNNKNNTKQKNDTNNKQTNKRRAWKRSR